MHELSIAMSIVELAEEEAERRGVQVTAVHLKLGALSGVVKEALLGSYEMAADDTPLKGSSLIIEDIPVMVFCSSCETQLSHQFHSIILLCRMRHARFRNCSGKRNRSGCLGDSR
jgi:hydrogenase nickel insertion protein HypA